MEPENNEVSYKTLKNRRYRRSKRAKQSENRSIIPNIPRSSEFHRQDTGISIECATDDVLQEDLDCPEARDVRQIETEKKSCLPTELVQTKKCKDCEEKDSEMKIKVEQLEKRVLKRNRKIEHLERDESLYKYYYEAGKGFESREIYNTMEDYVQQRTLDIAGSGTFDGRQAANQQLLDQGLILIPEKEVECNSKKGTGQNSMVFKGKFKDMDVAVKIFLGVPYSSVVKESQILTLLNSHPNIPHPFGVVQGQMPKLVLSTFSRAERLSNYRPDSEENLARLAAGLIDAMCHLHKNKILHNNINHSNVVVRYPDVFPLLCGFGHACLEDDAYYIPQMKLPTFGEECCLPEPIKRRLKKVSRKADTYCLGYTLRWHGGGSFTSDSKVCVAINQFAMECMGLLKDKPMTSQRLEDAISNFSIWAKAKK